MFRENHCVMPGGSNSKSLHSEYAALIQLEKLRHYLRTAYHYLFPGVAFRRYIDNSHGDEIEMDYLPVLVDARRGAIDVGANLGRYSLRLAPLAKIVWAFEPHPRLAYILRRCLPK